MKEATHAVQRKALLLLIVTFQVHSDCTQEALNHIISDVFNRKCVVNPELLLSDSFPMITRDKRQGNSIETHGLFSIYSIFLSPILLSLKGILELSFLSIFKCLPMLFLKFL